jgi:hypothetical protein
MFYFRVESWKWNLELALLEFGEQEFYQLLEEPFGVDFCCLVVLLLFPSLVFGRGILYFSPDSCMDMKFRTCVI